jgi:hypothetical protein
MHRELVAPSSVTVALIHVARVMIAVARIRHVFIYEHYNYCLSLAEYGIKNSRREKEFS